MCQLLFYLTKQLKRKGVILDHSFRLQPQSREVPAAALDSWHDCSQGAENTQMLVSPFHLMQGLAPEMVQITSKAGRSSHILTGSSNYGIPECSNEGVSGFLGIFSFRWFVLPNFNVKVFILYFILLYFKERMNEYLATRIKITAELSLISAGSKKISFLNEVTHWVYQPL